MKKVRESNIELFRIICMLAIIIYHFRWHAASAYESSGINAYFNYFALWLGPIGNLGFIYITAWFLDKFRFSLEKILRIVFKATIYSWLFMLFGKCVFHCEYNIAQMLIGLLPLIYGGYGYVQSYVLIYFFTPIIKDGIMSLEARRHLYLIIAFAILFMTIPMIFVGGRTYMTQAMEFVFAYLVMHYIKKYNPKTRDYVWWLSLILSFVFMLVYAYLSNTIEFSLLNEHTRDWAMEEYILMHIFVISLFMLFQKIKIKNKVINGVAAMTLGVYMIHEAPGVRDVIWIKLFNVNSGWGSSLYTMLRIIVVAIAMYILCLIIEFVLGKLTDILFDLIFKNLLQHQAEHIDSFVNNNGD